MNQTVRLIAYVGLITCAAIFGFCFYTHYGNFMQESSQREGLRIREPVPHKVSKPKAKRVKVLPGAPDRGTNQAPTNVESSLAPDNVSNAAPSNLNDPMPGKYSPTVAVVDSSGTKFSQLIFFGGAFFVTVLVLGFMVGHDFSHLMGEKFGKLLFNDEGESINKSGYEEAEELWANGNFLGAIQVMRDYLQAYPREQHAAVRIAEIYEKDLNNPLAAALEYEEILKQRLPAEQWGWMAIHLCNLYANKLNQAAKAVALLRRIDREHGETAAADKARKRLEILEAEAAAAKPEAPAPIQEPAPPPPPTPAQPANPDLQMHFERFHQGTFSAPRPPK